MHWQTNFCAHTNSNLYDNNACIDNILNIPLIRTITYRMLQCNRCVNCRLNLKLLTIFIETVLQTYNFQIRMKTYALLDLDIYQFSIPNFVSSYIDIQ